MLGYFIWMCFWFLYRNGSRSHSYIHPCSLSLSISISLSISFWLFLSLSQRLFFKNFFSFLLLLKILKNFRELHFVFSCYVDDYFPGYFCSILFYWFWLWYVDYFVYRFSYLYLPALSTIALFFKFTWFTYFSPFPTFWLVFFSFSTYSFSLTFPNFHPVLPV